MQVSAAAADQTKSGSKKKRSQIFDFTFFFDPLVFEAAAAETSENVAFGDRRLCVQIRVQM